MTYDAVLFDMDGVLLTGSHTPRRFYDRATAQLLSERGIDDPTEDFRNPDTVDAWRAACESHGLSADDLWERREVAVSDLENEHIAGGGREAYDDAEVLDRIEVPTGVVSNNRQRTVDFAVDHHDWDVEVALGRDPTLEGYERLKPEPYYLERALEAVDVDPPDALYVGDRVTDVQAADAIGADAALVARREEPEGGPEPAHVVETLRELESILATDPV